MEMDENKVGFWVGLLGLLTALVTWLRFRRKDRADTLKTYGDYELTISEAIKTKAEADMQLSSGWRQYAYDMRKERDKYKEDYDACQKRLKGLLNF